MVSMEELLQTARENGASDVHITVGAPPGMRINGSLVRMKYQSLIPDDTKQMLEGIMNEKQKQLLKEKGEADFSFSVSQTERCRIHIFKQRGFYTAVLHLIAGEIPDAMRLGIPQSVINLYRKKRGLILVTGPTGCGKSTTLAALINKINRNRHAHILTLENPIEYLYQNEKAIVNQREIGQDSDSYESALKAALREDADVILIDNLYDSKTIQMAIMAAETGHLVFSSLHTIGAANTIDYIIELFPPYQQQQIRLRLAGVLEAVISQQFIPTSDYRSQMVVFEVMHMNPTIKSLICEEKTQQIGAVIQAEKKQGMQTMDDAIFDLYIRGDINREQALIYAPDASILEKKLI